MEGGRSWLGGSGNSNDCTPIINPCGEGGVTLPDGTCVNSSNYPGKEEGMPYLWWTNTQWIKENFTFGIDEGTLAPVEGITWEEVFLTALFPDKALAIKANAIRAKSETVNRYGAEKWNDKSDAYKHTCWLALNTKAVGATLALQFATAHESEVPPERQMEVTMDMHNNSIGIFLFHSGLTDAQLMQAAYDAVVAGACWYLFPLNLDGSIKSDTVILPTNQ